MVCSGDGRWWSKTFGRSRRSGASASTAIAVSITINDILKTQLRYEDYEFRYLFPTRCSWWIFEDGMLQSFIKGITVHSSIHSKPVDTNISDTECFVSFHRRLENCPESSLWLLSGPYLMSTYKQRLATRYNAKRACRRLLGLIYLNRVTRYALNFQVLPLVVLPPCH